MLAPLSLPLATNWRSIFLGPEILIIKEQSDPIFFILGVQT